MTGLTWLGALVAPCRQPWAPPQSPLHTQRSAHLAATPSYSRSPSLAGLIARGLAARPSGASHGQCVSVIMCCTLFKPARRQAPCFLSSCAATYLNLGVDKPCVGSNVVPVSSKTNHIHVQTPLFKSIQRACLTVQPLPTHHSSATKILQNTQSRCSVHTGSTSATEQQQGNGAGVAVGAGDRAQWQRVVRASTSIRHHHPYAVRGGTAKRRCVEALQNCRCCCGSCKRDMHVVLVKRASCMPHCLIALEGYSYSWYFGNLFQDHRAVRRLPRKWVELLEGTT